jgi:proline dehydrogenase
MAVGGFLVAFSPVRGLAVLGSWRRTPHDLQAMVDLKPRIRLVKGAYTEPNKIAFQKRKEVDGQYAYLTDWLFDNGTDPAVATHDHRLIHHATQSARRAGAGKQDFEIQMLYGIRRDLQHRLATEGHRVRAYVPYGSAWYPYLMRRIAERPANIRFFLRALVRG